MMMIDWQPFAPQFEYPFSIAITLSKPYWLRPTTQGAARAAVYVTEGTIEGPGIRGGLVPMSGGDWPLQRPDGVLRERLIIRIPRVSLLKLWLAKATDDRETTGACATWNARPWPKHWC